MLFFPPLHAGLGRIWPPIIFGVRLAPHSGPGFEVPLPNRFVGRFCRHSEPLFAFGQSAVILYQLGVRRGQIYSSPAQMLSRSIQPFDDAAQ